MGNPTTTSRKRKSTRPIISSSDEEGTNKTGENRDSNITFEDAIPSKTHGVSSEKGFTKLARLNSVNGVLTARSKILRPPHSIALHSAASILLLRDDLLAWYDKVKNDRRMPWRKDYDPRLSGEAQTQRAYEVLVSEIMLQQTQIATVIPYYNRWMDTFPTVKSLSNATIEDVNQRWKGLGYYSRGARLLAAAQKVVGELGGRFPHTAASMEKQLPGVGRYTAGAVCSIVYNERSPAVDGNVQRLLSRLLAIHAPLKGSNAKGPLETIWKAAHDLVAGTDRAGAFNQALIELGSTVCKPTNPSCKACPLKKGCTAYQLWEGKITKRGEKNTDIEDLCTMCEPFPDTSTVVTRYPMKIEKKKAREESCAVSVIEYRKNKDRWFLLVRRPEKGLLAGLFEFPTLQLDSSGEESFVESDATALLLAKFLASPPPPQTAAPHSGSQNLLKLMENTNAGSLLHVFSHIRMTYHVRWAVLSDSAASSGSPLPALLQPEEMAGAGDSDSEVEERPSKRRKSNQKVKSRTISKFDRKSGNGRSPEQAVRMKWVKEADVEDENISTGALKIWKQVQTKW